MIKKILLITILLSPIVLMAGVQTSFADEAADAPARGKMTLECDKMNSKVLEYAQTQGWCLNETEGFNEGDCGSVAFDIVDDPSSSHIAQFSMYLWSSKGPMANVNYNVSWVNYSYGNSDSFGGSEWPFSSNWGKLTADETWNGTVLEYYVNLFAMVD